MKQTNINTCIIDDHPLIIEAYMTALQEVDQLHREWNFAIETAETCDEAQYLLTTTFASKPIDLVLLDIQVPPSMDNKLLSGEDIGLKIRETMPNAKIVITTTFNNNYRIQSIFKQINPEGFLIKSDIAASTLISALEEILTAPPYYSKTVMQSVRKYISHDFLLDKWDRLLLYELSQGTKMKELPNVLPFSLAALEKRKRHLKVLFEVEDGEDRDLFKKARLHGFI
ncbi:MAG: response regulator [Flavobacteriaceae bacterium]|nr:response regulator [Flavobacteriaceae bacterium]|tara:strand:- start:3966 stop:4646 length:681 start_codon:yes stop_codon:yes gene_type:complete